MLPFPLHPDSLASVLTLAGGMVSKASQRGAVLSVCGSMAPRALRLGKHATGRYLHGLCRRT